MRNVFIVTLMAFILAMMVGCEKRGGISVGVNSSGANSPKDTVVVKQDPNKLVTTTVTTSQKVEELVPPPPVKKVTICTDTKTTATLNGVPVKPDVQVHETPKVIGVTPEFKSVP